LSAHSWARARAAIDPVVAFAMLEVLMPLLSILAILVKLDGGPIFYGHRRVGFGGREFRCWKFRTMVRDADRVLNDLLARDPEARAEWERDFKLRRDPRVTWVGRVLRATSLDELPQLANVLRGEMALIGPRPIVEAEIPRYGRHIDAYFSCRPGITGLWQVSGRNDVSYRSRVLLDREYARHRSPLLDLRILGRTVMVVLRGRGAY
jgi:lipopolysaccharide/colanic/teichoic acid biosynthesis glycosyltransferase